VCDYLLFREFWLLLQGLSATCVFYKDVMMEKIKIIFGKKGIKRLRERSKDNNCGFECYNCFDFCNQILLSYAINYFVEIRTDVSGVVKGCHLRLMMIINRRLTFVLMITIVFGTFQIKA